MSVSSASRRGPRSRRGWTKWPGSAPRARTGAAADVRDRPRGLAERSGRLRRGADGRRDPPSRARWERYLTHDPGGEIRLTERPEARPGGARAPAARDHRPSADNDQPLLDSSGELRAALQRRDLQLRGAAVASSRRSGTSSGPTATPRCCCAAYAEWGEDCARAAGRACGRSRCSTPAATRCSSRATASGSSPSTTGAGTATLYFASEIKALLAVPAVPREPDEEVVRRFLLSGARRRVRARPSSAASAQLPAAHTATVPLGEGPAGMRVPSATGRRRPRDSTGASPTPPAEFAELFASAVSIHAAQRRAGRHLPQRRARLVVDRLRGGPSCGRAARSRATRTTGSATCPSDPAVLRARLICSRSWTPPASR